MTPAELNALNRLVAIKVMGWTQAWPAFKSGEFHICHDGSVLISTDGGKMQFFNPAESPADAMAVLRVLIQKHKKSICFCVFESGFQVYFGGADYAKSVVEAPTLETAICQFAVRLFQ